MKNSVLKRIIAVVLCLVVFAGSELAGVTNIVGDLFASEGSEFESEADESEEEPADEIQEITLADEEGEGEEAQPEEESGEEQPAEPEDVQADAENAGATDTENNVNEASEAAEGGEASEAGEGSGSSAEEETSGDAASEEDAEAPDGENIPEEGGDIQEGETLTETVEGEVPDSEAVKTEETNPAESENDGETELPADTEEQTEDEEEPEAFDEEYRDGQVVIHVAAEPGVIPNGAELLVTKIVQQDVEALDDEEEIAEAEELNAKYEDIKAELDLTVADDDTREIAGFVAYDVDFLLTDEDGGTAEIEPDGEVFVTMEFEEAYLPEEIAARTAPVEIDSIDVIHMEEAGEDEESETGLVSGVVEDADISTSEDAVESAAFTTDSSRTFVITWTENSQGEQVFTCSLDDMDITVTAAKGVIPDGAILKVLPIVADSQETGKQYQDVEKKLQEKAAKEDYEIAGFLAYDISFADENGVELEPAGEVKVAINYKDAAIPEELKDLASKTYQLEDSEKAAEEDSDEAEIGNAEAAKAETEAGNEDEDAAAAAESETKASEKDTEQSDTAVQTTNITVMHLEEDENGKVTKVVDMGAEGKVTGLKSTEDQKVESTEFVTDSFSTFTIVWTAEGYGTQTVEVGFYKYNVNASSDDEENLGDGETADNETAIENLVLTAKDENGTDIDLSNVNLNNFEAFNISDITKEGSRKNYYDLKDKNGRSYVFRKAKIFLNNSMFGNQCYELVNLRCENGSLMGLMKAEGSFNEQDQPITDMLNMGFKMEVRFYYSPIGELDPPLPTINNSDYGITMKMFDYVGEDPQKDILGSGPYDDEGWFQAGATQGAVKSRLENGYPVASGKGGTTKSLAPLFGGASHNGVIPYEADGLFLSDIYGKEGYFEYSSFENYAYLENGRFKVYDALGTPTGRGDAEENERTWLKRGNFLPFNDIGDRISPNLNLYNEHGEELEDEDPRKGEALYEADPQEINMCFGMYVGATFTQPKGGMAQFKGTKSPMIYEFNGDDDLWVFIDNALVLDIGGAHNACSGTINFSSGVVSIDGKPDTTIKAMFEKAELLPNGTELSQGSWTGNPEVDECFNGNTFADYSTHTIKIFYMEHGDSVGNASNLHIKMNLPTIQKGTVEVEKQLDTDKDKYKDVQFAFQMLVERDPSDGEVTEVVNGKTYVILDNPVDRETQENIPVTDESIGGKSYKNVFYLKPGQVAQFKNLDEDQMYFVREIGLRPNLYDHVTIRGTTVENHTPDGEATVEDVASTPHKVGEWPHVVYINECSEKNSNALLIKKQISTGQSTEDKFTFKVTLGNGMPLTSSYYLLVNGERIDREAPADGVIEDVPVGAVVVIDKLLSDTEITVEEQLKSEDYTLVGIAGNDGTYDSKNQTFTAIAANNGKYDAKTQIFAGTITEKDVEVTVTNAPKGVVSSGLNITKRLRSDSSEQIGSFEFNVTVVGQKKEEPFSGDYLLNGEQKSTTDGKITIPVNATVVINADAGTVFKIQEILSSEYDAPVIKVDGSDYTGSVVTCTIKDEKYTDVEVTNIPKRSYKWEIIKRSSSDETSVLANAGFELSSEDGKVKYYGLSDKSGLVKWYNNQADAESSKDEITDISEKLAAGDYQLTEVKAPAGFLKVAGSWTITVSGQAAPVIKGETDKAIAALGKTGGDDTNTIFYIKNDVIPYELPSTGGTGIFWYMISGVLLMMAGVLVLYKRKYAGRC